MKRSVDRLSSVVLAIFGACCLAVPLLGFVLDVGAGTDDRASEVIGMLHPEFAPKPLFSFFEPSETLEPWLFVGQVLIGISIFGWVVIYRLKKPKNNEDEDFS